MIGATQFTAATGATGAGVKIGVVDDGIDQTNPFFDPAGYSTRPASRRAGSSGRRRR